MVKNKLHLTITKYKSGTLDLVHGDKKCHFFAFYNVSFKNYSQDDDMISGALMRFTT